MTPSAALAMLVITWPGHDIQLEVVEKAECELAIEGIKTAVRVRKELYAMQSDVSAYCIPLNTAADQTIYGLLERPPAIKPVPAERPRIDQ